MAEKPFDPLDYLESLGVRVVLRAGGSGFRLTYGEPLKAHQRRKVQKVVEAYAGLLRLQLEGERPRSVMNILPPV